MKRLQPAASNCYKVVTQLNKTFSSEIQQRNNSPISIVALYNYDVIFDCMPVIAVLYYVFEYLCKTDII